MVCGDGQPRFAWDDVERAWANGSAGSGQQGIMGWEFSGILYLAGG